MGGVLRRRIPWLGVLALGCALPSERGEEPPAPSAERAEAGSAEDASSPHPSDADAALGAKPESEPEAAAVSLGEMVVGLRVSASLVETLVPIEQADVPEEELGRLFASLTAAAAPFCAFKHGLGDWDGEAARAYLASPGVFRRTGTGSKYGVIAGCWNFLHMNDRAPHRDFELVARLYAAPAHDCVSVGLMQPYLMHDRLGCRRLTALDFDWRIHDAHWQVIGLARQGVLGKEQQTEGLAGLELAYIAHLRARPEHPGTIESLCHVGMTERCAEALDHFQRSLDPSFEGVRPQRFTLELAPLHEARFEPAPEVAERPLRVVYLSNALEPIYTRRSEARALLDHLAEALAEGEMAVLVHHAGGRRGFGLYELRREGEGRIVRVRCRDVYESTATDAEAETYDTWLDREASGPAQPPACTELLGRARAEARREHDD